MSICRWSCDNFRSDVYIYECEGGWSVNVRRVHPVNPEILGDDFNEQMYKSALESDTKEMMALYKRHQELLEQLKYEPLDSPHAGRSFSLDTLEDLLRFVVILELQGVYVPQKVFDYIEEES